MAKKKEEKKDLVNFDKIVEELSPHNLYKKIIKPHREAYIKHRGEKHSVSGYKEFMDEATKYIGNHWKEVYGNEMPEHMASGKVDELLRIIQQQSGKSLEELIQDAKKGGFQDLITNMGRLLENQDKRNYNTHVLREIDPTNYDQRLEVAKKYTDKLKQFIPKGYKPAKPESMAKDYDKLLDQFSKISGNAIDSLYADHK